MISVKPNLKIFPVVIGLVFAVGLIFAVLAITSTAASPRPAWWSNLDSISENQETTTQARASELTLGALEALTKVSAEIGDHVRKELAKNGYDESSLRAKISSPEAKDRQLTHPELISMAAPFYNALAEAAPEWLDHADPEKSLGQLQINGTKDPSKPLNFYPWPWVSPDNPPPESKVTNDQLLKAFTLRFESLSEHKPFGKIKDLARIAAVLNNSVDRRLLGLDGGEKNMAVFSIYDHLFEAYSRNEELWCGDLGNELTGVTVFKAGTGLQTNPGDSYGGVMITPRHILFCNHAHPAYPGSPPPWVNGLGHRIRFVSAEGEIILRNLVWGRQVEGNDLWLGVLEEDLPETIKSYRIFPKIDGLNPSTAGLLGAVEVGFSQGSIRLPPEMSHTKFEQLCGRCETSHYGSRSEVDGVPHYSQQPMIYVSNLGAVDCGTTKGSELRAPFRYCVWDGDSGTPRFHLFGKELLLTRIILSAGGGGLTLGDRVDKLNETIKAADAEALEQGKIEAITNHTVQVAPLDELTARKP